MKKVIVSIALIGLIGFMAGSVIAQEPQAVPDEPAIEKPDDNNVNVTDAAVIIVPLLILGAILKNAFPSFPNRLIPLITVVGGTLGFAVKTGDYSFNGWFTACLVACSATGLHSGIKNTAEGAGLIAIPKVPLWVLAPLLGGLLLFGAGCQGPGGVYDPVRTQEVKDTLEPAVRIPVRRVVMNSPKHSDEIAMYFRSVQNVFCAMRDSRQFDPTSLTAGLQAIIPPQQSGIVQDLLDFRVALEALYKRYWNDRFRAELPEDQWAYHVSDFFCMSIGNGLKDAGK